MSAFLGLVLGVGFLIVGVGLFIGGCFLLAANEPPRDTEDVDEDALPPVRPRVDPEERSGDATHLAPVSSLPGADRGLDAGRASASDLYVDHYAAERRIRITRLQDRRN